MIKNKFLISVFFIIVLFVSASRSQLINVLLNGNCITGQIGNVQITMELSDKAHQLEVYSYNIKEKIFYGDTIDRIRNMDIVNIGGLKFISKLNFFPEISSSNGGCQSLVPIGNDSIIWNFIKTVAIRGNNLIFNLPLLPRIMTNITDGITYEQIIKNATIIDIISNSNYLHDNIDLKKIYDFDIMITQNEISLPETAEFMMYSDYDFPVSFIPIYNISDTPIVILGRLFTTKKPLVITQNETWVTNTYCSKDDLVTSWVISFIFFFLVISWTFQRFEYDTSWFVYENIFNIIYNKERSQSINRNEINVKKNEISMKLYIPRTWTYGNGLSCCYSRSEIIWNLLMTLNCVLLYLFMDLNYVMRCRFCSLFWICDINNFHDLTDFPPLYKIRYVIEISLNYYFWILIFYNFIMIIMTTIYNHRYNKEHMQYYIPMIDILSLFVWMLSIPMTTDVFESLFWILNSIVWIWNCTWSISECTLFMKFNKKSVFSWNLVVTVIILLYTSFSITLTSFCVVLGIMYDTMTIIQLYLIFFLSLGISVTLPMLLSTWICTYTFSKNINK